jgi:hypothetical protein
MAYQGFIEKLFIKNATKQEFTWLSTQVTMLCASFIENFRILTPFLVEMCTFPSPTTFIPGFFDFAHKKWIFHFISGQNGQKRWFFVKGLPRKVCKTPPLQFSWVGDLVGMSDPTFEELYRLAAIY